MTRSFLPPEEFEALFPFHMALGPELALRQLGRTLARVLPDAHEGDAFTRHFEFARPRVAEPTLERLRQQARSLVLLRARALPLTLRGQIVYTEGDPAAFFVGSPWVTSQDQLATLGLTFSDFAIHDPLADALVLMRAQERSLHESQRLVAELAARRSELEQATAELSERLREVAAQRDLIRALSTPVIAVWRGIVVLPIIGVLDHQRGELVGLAALDAVSQHRARIVILDLTGVTTPQGDVVPLIQRIANTLRLLGVRCSLVGLTPAMAMAMSRTDAPLDGISVHPTLHAGLRAALADAQAWR